MTATAPASSQVSPADTIRLYRAQSVGCRFYVRVRRILLPLADLDRHVPKRGRILDVGCGFGLLANFLAMRSPERTVRGIDLAPERIAVARRVSRTLANVCFDVADLKSLDAGNQDAVLLIDTLHYFAPCEQGDIVAACRRALVGGGTFICRDSVRESGPRFWWNQLHELLMVHAGITTTTDRKLHFLPLNELRDTICAAGFEILTIEGPRRYLPYTDTILVARAGTNSAARIR